MTEQNGSRSPTPETPQSGARRSRRRWTWSRPWSTSARVACPRDRAIVTPAELEPALAEIGAVQVPGAAAAPELSPRAPGRERGPVTARPLRQISEGAVVSGVCQGLARYFGLDVTLLRVITVLLLLVTGGGVIPVYLALMLLMPYAPLEPGAKQLRWLPAKCRSFVEFVRAKLGFERTGDLPA